MFKRIIKMLRRPTPLEIATTALVDTELALLLAQAHKEGADAEIACYSARIKRLKSYITANSKDTVREIPDSTL